MTSGISFFDLLKQNIRLRGWFLILMIISSVIAFPVRLAMILESLRQMNEHQPAGVSMYASDLERMIEYEVGSVLGMNVFLLFLVGVAALIAGVTGYAYLHSKEKMDHYQSFAIRREKFFFVPFLGGWLMAVVPYAAAKLLALFAVAPAFSAFRAGFVGMTFLAMAQAILYFTVLYAVVVLSMVLTGRILTGVLLAGFFFCYGPACYFLTTSVFPSFFRTYCSFTGRGFGLYSSPATTALINRGNTFTVPMVIALILYGAVALFLAVFFYKKRPSEAAEQALIYRPMQAIIKIMVAIPGALLCGIFTSALTGSDSNFSFVLWSIIGAVLINLIVEFVYSTNLKNNLRHYKSFLIIVAGVVFVLVILLFDLFGYDRYLPSRDRVASITVSPQAAVSEIGEAYGNDIGRAMATFLAKEGVGDTDRLYELAARGVEVTNQSRSREYDPSLQEFGVCYHLTNGKTVYRTYQIPKEELRKAFADLSADPGFRERYYMLDRLNASQSSGISYTPWGLVDCGPVEVQLTKADLEELQNCLTEDAAKEDLTRLSAMEPVGEIRLITEYHDYYDDPGTKKDYNYDDFGGSIYLYPSYEKTLSFLKAHGIDVTAPEAELLKAEYACVIDKEAAYAFTDPEEIRQLLQCLTRTKSYDAENGGVILELRAEDDYYGECRITDPATYKRLIAGKENIYA